VRLLYTVQEAADSLSIGLTKMYELLAIGAVRSIKIGTARRIEPTALAEYIEAQAQAWL